jgi:hypothetical protein
MGIFEIGESEGSLDLSRNGTSCWELIGRWEMGMSGIGELELGVSAGVVCGDGEGAGFTGALTNTVKKVLTWTKTIKLTDYFWGFLNCFDK